MPHKHKRDKSQADTSSYDLPPSKSAYALPVKKAPSTPAKPSKRKHANLQADTPRAFTRLLHAYRPPRSGLDDGNRPSKKRKVSSKANAENDTAAVPPSLPPPTILPHEPLSAFNARVDAALPFSGLSKKSGGGKDLAKGKQTKTERKMQKMQKEWREEDKRRKEKREEEEDEAGDEDGAEKPVIITGKSKKAKKRKREGGDENPWAHIKAKGIDTAGSGGLVGLHDVVLAPPRFSKGPKGKENFGIGKGVGGLKRQEELSEARRSVIEGYRQLMREKRGGEG